MEVNIDHISGKLCVCVHVREREGEGEREEGRVGGDIRNGFSVENGNSHWIPRIHPKCICTQKYFQNDSECRNQGTI